MSCIKRRNTFVLCLILGLIRGSIVLWLNIFDNEIRLFRSSLHLFLRIAWTLLWFRTDSIKTFIKFISFHFSSYLRLLYIWFFSCSSAVFFSYPLYLQFGCRCRWCSTSLFIEADTLLWSNNDKRLHQNAYENEDIFAPLIGCLSPLVLTILQFYSYFYSYIEWSINLLSETKKFTENSLSFAIVSQHFIIGSEFWIHFQFKSIYSVRCIAYSKAIVRSCS